MRTLAQRDKSITHFMDRFLQKGICGFSWKWGRERRGEREREREVMGLQLVWGSWKLREEIVPSPHSTFEKCNHQNTQNRPTNAQPREIGKASYSTNNQLWDHIGLPLGVF